MSTGFTAYIGYMVAMNIGQNDDLESCLDFLKEHEEYNLYDCNEEARAIALAEPDCLELCIDGYSLGGYEIDEDDIEISER